MRGMASRRPNPSTNPACLVALCWVCISPCTSPCSPPHLPVPYVADLSCQHLRLIIQMIASAAGLCDCGGVSGAAHSGQLAARPALAAESESAEGPQASQVSFPPPPATASSKHTKLQHSRMPLPWLLLYRCIMCAQTPNVTGCETVVTG